MARDPYPTESFIGPGDGVDDDSVEHLDWVRHLKGALIFSTSLTPSVELGLWPNDTGGG